MRAFSLFRSYPAAPSSVEVAMLAGRLLAMCVEREEGFSRDLHGWRIVVGPIVDHREMVSTDLDDD